MSALRLLNSTLRQLAISSILLLAKYQVSWARTYFRDFAGIGAFLA